jgi:hypothetical protein
VRLVKHAVGVLHFRQQAGDQQRVAFVVAVKSDAWSGRRQR